MAQFFGQGNFRYGHAFDQTFWPCLLYTSEKDNKGRPKWFRVQVLVRGTDADASAAKQVLVKMGLKDATQVSKKPVRGR